MTVTNYTATTLLGNLTMSLLNLNSALASRDEEPEPVEDEAMLIQAIKVVQGNVMLADADCNITYLNDSVTEMLGGNEAQLRTALPSFSVSSLVGTNIDGFHKDPAHQRGMLRNLREVYKTQIEVAGFTFGLVATPLFSDDGTRLGTVVE